MIVLVFLSLAAVRLHETTDLLESGRDRGFVHGAPQTRIVPALYGCRVLSIHHDAIGICPAILVPDPLTPSDDSFEGTIRAATTAGFRTFSLWSFWPVAYGVERVRRTIEERR